jgi:hypothetical protein
MQRLGTRWKELLIAVVGFICAILGWGAYVVLQEVSAVPVTYIGF